MKTDKLGFRHALILAGLFAVVIPALAGGEIHLNAGSENRATVSYSAFEPADVKISIEDQDETMVFYSEQKNHVGEYRKMFDLSQLKDGNYRLIAFINGEKQVKNFSVIGAKMNIDNKLPSSETVRPPFFKEIDGYLVCLYENQLSEDVQVRFLSDGVSFFKDKSFEGTMYNKKFNLSHLPDGNYEIILSSGDTHYSYEFLVE